MSSHKFSMILIFLALALTLVSMVIGPFGIVSWALTTAVLACFFALASIAVSMQSWEEQDVEDYRMREEGERKDEPQAPGLNK